MELGHAFHELARLLALNHSRYEEEVRMGLHAKAKGGRMKAERGRGRGAEVQGCKGDTLIDRWLLTIGCLRLTI